MKQSTADKLCDKILEAAHAATADIREADYTTAITFSPFDVFGIVGDFHSGNLAPAMQDLSPTLSTMAGAAGAGRISYKGSKRKFLERVSDAVEDIGIEVLAITDEHLRGANPDTKLTPKHIIKSWRKFGKAVRNLYLETL